MEPILIAGGGGGIGRAAVILAAGMLRLRIFQQERCWKHHRDCCFCPAPPLGTENGAVAGALVFAPRLAVADP